MESFYLLCLLVMPKILFGQNATGTASQVTNSTTRDWGPWTEWTTCDQTCGPGTQYRIRRCHGSSSISDCEGPTKQLKICNIRKCPSWHIDYRTKECSEHDRIFYGGRTYRWVPYINEASPCQLSCKSVGHGYYAKFKKSVADGITCNEEDTAICMKGQCLVAGCDGILNSGSKLDRCGVCGGHGESCRLYSGIFTRTHLNSRGYNNVATIPVGARNVNITELGRSKNYLALSTPSGYFLNGNRRLQPQGTVQGAGTVFKYRSGAAPWCRGGCLTAEGPTNVSLRVELLSFGRNPGIMYTYTVPNSQIEQEPSEESDNTEFPSLKEIHVRNSPIYVSSTSHHRRRQQLNQRTSKNIIAARALSKDAAFGERARRQDRRRNHRRRISPSTTNHRRNGGNAGTPRDYGTSSLNDNRLSSRNDYQRSANDFSRPNPRDSRQPKATFDSIVNYSDPLQYRHYYHTNALDGLGDVPVKGQIPRDDPKRRRGNSIPDLRYAEHRATTQISPRPNIISSQTSLDNTIPLPPVNRRRGDNLSRASADNGVYSWRISGFTKCTEPCGGGLQETRVVCVKSDSQVEVMEENCNPGSKPEPTTVVCNNHPCKARWFLEDWGPCSVTCGRGLQKRDVSCQQRISPTLSIPVAAPTCPSPRPQSRQYCQLDPCFVWKVSNWTKCSTVCGLGQRTRDLTCVDWKGKKVQAELCVQIRPKQEEICDMGSCAHGWFHSKWSKQCSSECGRGYYVRRVYCSASDGSSLDEGKCHAESKKPRDKKACRSPKPCGGQWFAGPWSQCNSTCGTDAFRQRDVLCIKRHGRRVRGITKNHNCDERLKPKDTEPCQSLPRCIPQWYMMPWTKCSKSCDTGVKTREVKCVDENFKPSPDCDRKRKPARRQSCNTHPCDATFSAFSDSVGPKTQILQKDGSIKEVPSCEDKNSSRWCRTAGQARLCGYKIYRDLCCRTCKTLG